MVMSTAVMSTKGQLVIPAEVRRRADLQAGDGLVVEYDEVAREIRLRKQESVLRQIDQLSARFTALIKPGTPALMDPSAFFETREARL
jgi:AbrB family looped-hinge helix DNA binding protein